MVNLHIGTVAIIAIIMVILFNAIYDPRSITYVIIAILILFALASRKHEHATSTPVVLDDEPIIEDNDDEPDEQMDEPDEKKDEPDEKKDENMDKMSESNRWSLEQLYGRRGSPMDDRITKHKQRIGDRDRKATITQIRARRNNAMEPYYRQELSQHGNKRWWDPDPILSRKATPEQQSTIMKGPRPNW